MQLPISSAYSCNKYFKRCLTALRLNDHEPGRRFKIQACRYGTWATQLCSEADYLKNGKNGRAEVGFSPVHGAQDVDPFSLIRMGSLAAANSAGAARQTFTADQFHGGGNTGAVLMESRVVILVMGGTL